MRGHGKSQKPRKYEDYKLEKFADDLQRIISHLQIKRPILIGHSFGSIVVLEFLLRHESDVAGAVFISPNVGIQKTLWGKMGNAWVHRLAKFLSLLPFHPRLGIQLNYADRYKGTGDWNIRRMFADIRNTTVRIYFYSLSHLYAKNRDAWWNKLSLPSLVVHGSKDRIIPLTHARDMMKGMHNSRLTIIEGANHVLVLTRVREVNQILKDFVASI